MKKAVQLLLKQQMEKQPFVGEVKKISGVTSGNLSMVSIFGVMVRWVAVSHTFAMISILLNQETVKTMKLPGLQ